MSTTIRITYVRLAGRYRIDEVAGDGVVRAEISPAVSGETFTEHLAALVADFPGCGRPASWCDVLMSVMHYTPHHAHHGIDRG